ncbi:MAG: hypothetical protein Nk1A_8530 [Endomicrobiia bacterium]|nr:MAG: hypothetical protein Nk1A_8530 [Endomicrobiia bacterium]
MDDYFNIRYQDKSPYSVIGDRIDLSDYVFFENSGDSRYTYFTHFGGDCFVSDFTHRMNRNFQDPEAPNNDEIVDINTWEDHYSSTDSDKNADINRGDVNAVQLGHWVTFRVCCNVNLNFRDIDKRFPEE